MQRMTIVGLADSTSKMRHLSLVQSLSRLQVAEIYRRNPARFLRVDPHARDDRRDRGGGKLGENKPCSVPAFKIDADW